MPRSKLVEEIVAQFQSAMNKIEPIPGTRYQGDAGLMLSNSGTRTTFEGQVRVSPWVLRSTDRLLSQERDRDPRRTADAAAHLIRSGVSLVDENPSTRLRGKELDPPMLSRGVTDLLSSTIAPKVLSNLDLPEHTASKLAQTPSGVYQEGPMGFVAGMLRQTLPRRRRDAALRYLESATPGYQSSRMAKIILDANPASLELTDDEYQRMHQAVTNAVDTNLRGRWGFIRMPTEYDYGYMEGQASALGFQVAITRTLEDPLTPNSLARFQRGVHSIYPNRPRGVGSGTGFGSPSSAGKPIHIQSYEQELSLRRNTPPRPPESRGR